jgi:hypothetical protein
MRTKKSSRSSSSSGKGCSLARRPPSRRGACRRRYRHVQIFWRFLRGAALVGASPSAASFAYEAQSQPYGLPNANTTSRPRATFNILALPILFLFLLCGCQPKAIRRFPEALCAWLRVRTRLRLENSAESLPAETRSISLGRTAENKSLLVARALAGKRVPQFEIVRSLFYVLPVRFRRDKDGDQRRRQARVC